MKRNISDQGIFGLGIATETYDSMFAGFERHNPTEYDKIMDRVYAATHIGGGQHRSFDGSHTFAGSYDEIVQSTGEIDAYDYFEAHANELVTPEGIPLLTLDKSEFSSLTNELAEVLGDQITPGQLREFFVDLNGFNAGELLGATVGVGFTLMAIHSGDSRAISRVVSLNLCVGLATANPLQVFAGLAGLGHGVATGKIEAWGLLAGALPAAAGLTTFEIATEVLKAGKAGSLVAAIAVSIGAAAIMGKLEANTKKRVDDELGGNANYIAVQSAPVLLKEIEFLNRRRGSLAVPF